MRDDLAKELEQIGLSENEAKVYLAGLALGPSTAQMIAAKATVSRPTTYIMIESLIKRGLMSSFQKGKKKVFSAAPPNQLLYVIASQQRELQERSERLKSIINKIEIGAKKTAGPTVTIFEGMDGMRAIQERVLASTAKEIFEVTSVDKVRRYLPALFPGDTRAKIDGKFIIKSIYTSSSGPIDDGRDLNSKLLDNKKYDIAGEVIIADSEIIFISYGDKIFGVGIEDEDIAKTLKTMFLSLWNDLG